MSSIWCREGLPRILPERDRTRANQMPRNAVTLAFQESSHDPIPCRRGARARGRPVDMTRARLPRRLAMPALAATLAALGPAAFAQAGAAPPTASTWGRPLGAASAPAAGASSATPSASMAGRVIDVPTPKPAPSPYAAARARSTATGEYFHDFGELIVRVRAVKWIEEICSEAFPATAETNEHAYDDWLLAHGPFVREMEGQFEVIGRYWGNIPERLRKDGFDVESMKARIESNKDGLRADFHATSAAAFQRRCEAYPEILLSPQLDLEKSQADYVTSVRMGPR